MDAFTARLGLSQGRVTDASGDVVFVLGDLKSGRVANLAPGDYVEIAQTLDVSTVGLVVVRGTLRAPGAGKWHVALRVAGVEVAGLDGWPGRTRNVSDLTANVSGQSGATEIAVRLTFAGT
jgi:hypothetical protein